MIIAALIYISMLDALAVNVSGMISNNTTWTLANSPYIVTGNLLVANGVTLNIEPGVLVKFKNSCALQIDGTLIAQGTVMQKIIFTSDSLQSPGAWGNIHFTNTSSDATYNISGGFVGGSVLEYCTIEYAGGSGGITMDGAHPFINHCNILNNAGGVYASGLSDTLKITNSKLSYNNANGGIHVNGGITIISNDTISNNFSNNSNGGGGIYSENGTIYILHNVISNNVAALEGGGGIVTWSSYASISNNIISKNIVNSFDSFGGGISTYGEASISNNIIINNSSGSRGGGIDIYGNVKVLSNIIAYNSIQIPDFFNTSIGAGGIYIMNGVSDISNNIIAENFGYKVGGGVYYSSDDAKILSHNTIYKNIAEYESGIFQEKASNDSVKFNTVIYNIADTNGSTLVMKGNPFFKNNNIFSNSSIYELRNQNTAGPPPYFDALNNWWGTVNDTLIKQKIYDWFDNASLGIVEYTPYLLTADTNAPVSSPKNVIKKDMGGGQVLVTWNKNPEADIAGYFVYSQGFTGYSFINSFNAGSDTSYLLSAAFISDTIAVTAFDNSYNIINDDPTTIVNDNLTLGFESWFSIAALNNGSMVVHVNSTNVSCNGLNNGTATALVSGGTPPYSFIWSTMPVQTNSTATNLSAGHYSITVTDSNNVSVVDSFIVTQPLPLTVILNSINASCPTCSDANATANPSGGTPPYFYTWYTTPMQSTNTANGLLPGSYGICVNDSNLCLVCDTVNITLGNCSAYFNLYPDSVILHHYYAVNMAFGIPPLSYSWDWGDGTYDTIPYPTHIYNNAGFYAICLIITDSIGCNAQFCNSYYLQKSINSMVYINVIPQITDINESFTNNSFSLYPNPVENILTIENHLLNSNVDEFISIYNIQGQILFRQPFIKDKMTIDISNFENGVYLVRMNNATRNIVSKIIKE